jgi:Gpi18-like mannosyltransferase
MNKKLLAIFVSAFIFRLILSFITWHPDVNNHIDWGIRFWQYGPAKFYPANVWSFTWPNQPPGTIYIFAAIRKVYEAVFDFFWWININIPIFPSGIITFFESNLYPALLKLPGVLADLGIAYLIFIFFKKSGKEKVGLFGAALFLFNPVIWYNSAFWGQTDSIINFLALFGFFLLLERKLIWATLALVLSFYIKASLLIFLPIFVIIAIRQRYKLSEYIKAISYSLAPIALLTLPFSGGEPFGWLIALYKDKVFTQQLQVITANAFNLWAAVAGIHERPHTLLLGPLTYQTWGLILFAFSYIPALYLVFKKQDIKSVVWALAIASFASFIFLTNMHERYLYPLFPYLTMLTALGSVSLLLYWLVSLISLVNLYNFWWVPRIESLVNVLSFGDRLMPRLLGASATAIFIYLYVSFLRLLKRA